MFEVVSLLSMTDFKIIHIKIIYYYCQLRCRHRVDSPIVGALYW